MKNTLDKQLIYATTIQYKKFDISTHQAFCKGKKTMKVVSTMKLHLPIWDTKISKKPLAHGVGINAAEKLDTG